MVSLTRISEAIRIVFKNAVPGLVSKEKQGSGAVGVKGLGRVPGAFRGRSEGVPRAGDELATSGRLTFQGARRAANT